MSILIAINGWDRSRWAERMRRLAPDREVRLHTEPGDPAGVRYALCWKPPHGLVATLPDVEVVFSLGAGVDHVLSDPDLPDVPVVRVVDPSLTRRMSEWVVLQTLFHHRLMPRYLDRQRAKDWQPLGEPMAASTGVGIMGLGVLGRDAAGKLAALGFDVAGWSRSPREVEGISCFHGADGLDAFLARTDILVVLLPHTPDTDGLIDYPLLSRLRRDNHIGGGVLINAGRGGLQVEEDILRALADGSLAGASLDVFVTEPLPPESPFWTHHKVFITPHTAAESDPDYICRYVMEQISRHEAGKGLDNVVDRARGY